MSRSNRLLLALLAVPIQASAWGYPQHALIGELAERRLDPATLAEVRALLIDEPVPTLAAVAVWADDVRPTENWRWTAPFHYVKFADARCDRVLPADCKRGLCLYAAIERYRDELADRALSRQQRAEALKFLVHFVGDAHQPLHSGWREDRGGNQFQIRIGDEGSNLHKFWDAHLLPMTMDAVAATADAWPDPPSGAELGFAPYRWTADSCALADAIGLYPPQPGALPPGYADRMRPHAQRQLALAAARLAATLNAALTRPGSAARP